MNCIALLKDMIYHYDHQVLENSAGYTVRNIISNKVVTFPEITAIHKHIDTQ